MDFRRIIATGALLGTVAVGSQATAQPAATAIGPVRVAQVAPNMKLNGERASNSNINYVYHQLLEQIEQLQRDQRDYGGYRAKAVENLKRAKRNLEMAMQWDKSHNR